jgi:hypothetical protein
MVRGATRPHQNGWYIFGIQRWENDQKAIHGYAIDVMKRVFSAWVDCHGEQEFTVPEAPIWINKRAFWEPL